MVRKVTTPQLVLFDIDGTLIYHTGALTYEMVRRQSTKFSYAIREVFHIDVLVDASQHRGSIDKKILWDSVKDKGVRKADFERKMPELSSAMHRWFVKTVKNKRLYTAIPDAKELVRRLRERNTAVVGVLTGNVRSIAEWKLEYAGFKDSIQFGIYGEDADDRISLAHKVLVKARAHFHVPFQPKDVTVIGDTVYDIRAGKAIGAKTIAVTTGGHVGRDVLMREEPDGVVDSLLDQNVLSHFHLQGKKGTIHT